MSVADENLKDITRERFDELFKGKIEIDLNVAWQKLCDAQGRSTKAEEPKAFEHKKFEFKKPNKKKNK